ncbi:unnamed protein product [Nesidiocoris tenuis]|uniref:Uncharacterized protein n=1 Tax=Nesidiocoris tenuis TaxID=355587 RepID=A0A6H5HFU2_9HEMI|nr:unnamed protein product [Nesidiocoris tenuis]
MVNTVGLITGRPYGVYNGILVRCRPIFLFTTIATRSVPKCKYFTLLPFESERCEMFDFKSIALWTFAIFSLSTAVFGKLPPYIKACKADANLESCVLAQQEQVIARLSNGGAKLEFSILYDEVKKGKKKVMFIKSTELTHDLDSMKIRMDNLFNGDKALASYIKACKVDENLESCVLSQQASVIARIRDGGLKVFFWLRYDELKRGGKKIMVIKRFETTHVLEKLSIRMDNLFNGDNVLVWTGELR